MNIYDFGWSDTFINYDIDTDNLARITAVHRSVCKAITAKGEVNIYLSGRFLNDDTFSLATGDYILMSPCFIDEQNKPAAVVEDLLPRRSKLSRVAAGGSGKEQVLASNLDYVFIVTSANDDFNVNRLQRYALLAEQGGVKPIVILSKVDLIEDPAQLVTQVKERMESTPVFAVSSIDQIGYEPILELLKKGITGAFVGSSGVGKSTLVNLLLDREAQTTQEIRGDDSKGRHTTTSRELFFLEKGGMVIDTAGLREVQVFSDEANLSSTFQGVSALIDQCRFSDCTHQNEPGCAINQALDSGELSQDEYDNYLKLQKEARFNERKMNKATASNDKRRWKEINQNMRARRKFEGKD